MEKLEVRGVYFSGRFENLSRSHGEKYDYIVVIFLIFCGCIHTHKPLLSFATGYLGASLQHISESFILEKDQLRIEIFRH